MPNVNYTIRSMTQDEVALAVDWAAKEGWNPGLHDAECYATPDPNGFLIGLLDDTPIATISAVRYGRTFGFIGFYIVKPEYRGKGYGIQIWNAALKHLEGRNIGLDGVLAQQDNYRKSGFRLAYSNIRYQGTGGGPTPSLSGIVELATMPIEQIEAYGGPFFPANRSSFTEAWIHQPGCHALGIQEGGELKGYGVIRPCRSGYKIGPLYAENPDIAETLFLALKSRVGISEPVFLDVPEVNHSAVEMARRHHMEVVFETARMYTREFPDLPLERIYGVTSFEVG